MSRGIPEGVSEAGELKNARKDPQDSGRPNIVPKAKLRSLPSNVGGHSGITKNLWVLNVTPLARDRLNKSMEPRDSICSYNRVGFRGNRFRVSGQDRISGSCINQETNRLTCHVQGHLRFLPCDDDGLLRSWWEARAPSVNHSLCREAVGLCSLRSRDNFFSSALFVCTGARLFWRIWALLTPVIWAYTFKQGSLPWCSFSGVSRVVLRWLRSWSIYNCSQKTGLCLVSSSGLLFLSFLFSLSWLLKTLKAMSMRWLVGVWGPIANFCSFLQMSSADRLIKCILLQCVPPGWWDLH